MVFKIGVAGTHSTGKTTFLDKLHAGARSFGLRVNRVSDLGTKASAAGFPILREHTFESTLWIMSQGTADELMAELTCDVLLVDRPVIDALGYLNAALCYRGEVLPSWQSDILIRYAQANTHSYDVLMKTALDQSIPLGSGKERDQDATFRALVAREMDLVFTDAAAEFDELNADNHEVQVNGIMREITRRAAPADAGAFHSILL